MVERSKVRDNVRRFLVVFWDQSCSGADLGYINNMGHKVLNSKTTIVIVDFQPKVHGAMKTKPPKFLGFSSETNEN